MADASIIPANEPQRLAAVRRYDILDTPLDGAFDGLRNWRLGASACLFPSLASSTEIGSGSNRITD